MQAVVPKYTPVLDWHNFKALYECLLLPSLSYEAALWRQHAARFQKETLPFKIPEPVTLTESIVQDFSHKKEPKV